jgi:hypothetical protein
MEMLCKNCGKPITTYRSKNSELDGEPIHENGLFSCDVDRADEDDEDYGYAEFPDEDNDS